MDFFEQEVKWEGQGGLLAGQSDSTPAIPAKSDAVLLGTREAQELMPPGVLASVAAPTDRLRPQLTGRQCQQVTGMACSLHTRQDPFRLPSDILRPHKHDGRVLAGTGNI